MIARLLPLLTLLFITTLSASITEPTPEETRADFEFYASRVAYLYTGAYLYDRIDQPQFILIPREHQQAQNALLQLVTNPAYPVEVLVELLQHEDPKVRTLAAVAIFDREEPSLLPMLAELWDDTSSTFSDPILMSVPYPMPDGRTQIYHEMTVGKIVQQMLTFYMVTGGYRTLHIYTTQEDFYAYWQPRQDRTFCASWFEVQLLRAGRDNPWSVRQRIEQLPPEDKLWTLIYLRSAHGSSRDLVHDRELIDMCRELGSAKIFEILRGAVLTDDPDLLAEESQRTRFDRIRLFVLHNAAKILQPEDADELLAIEQEWNVKGMDPNGEYTSPWYAISAARLNPPEARAILHPAFARMRGASDRDRATICLALWEMVGEEETDFIVEWFYRRDQGTSSRWALESFITEIVQRPQGSMLLAALIEDPRFGSCGWEQLSLFVKATNAVLPSPSITEDELQQARHPLHTSYDWQQEKAWREYPEESRQLEAILEGWRQALRQSVPQLIEAAQADAGT
ncbi:MAG: HEAT repeat domain-containing protein [Verrucomicrobiota bacterium JB022]|nr:HEAT repeat domain-containing protein [Verrucomicrobiota bacterium JB022]